MIKYNKTIENECNIRGVSFNIIADVQSTKILQSIFPSFVLIPVSVIS